VAFQAASATTEENNYKLEARARPWSLKQSDPFNGNTVGSTRRPLAMLDAQAGDLLGLGRRMFRPALTDVDAPCREKVLTE